jgi:hypothetical protein
VDGCIFSRGVVTEGGDAVKFVSDHVGFDVIRDMGSVVDHNTAIGRLCVPLRLDVSIGGNSDAHIQEGQRIGGVGELEFEFKGGVYAVKPFM